MNQVSEAQVISDQILTPEEKAHNDAESYRQAPQKERTDTILKLYDQKGIKNPDGKPVTRQQVEKNSLDKQIEVIEKLLLTPDELPELP